MTDRPELTVLLPVLNERDNVVALLPRLGRILIGLGCTHEVLVVDGGSRDGTAAAARALGARVMVQNEPGYGGALREGFAAATGEYLLTLDADLSHDPDFIVKLWRARDSADVVIASRYVKGGAAYMELHRKLLSRTLNRFFAIGLGIPMRDLSSGFRLYRRRVITGLVLSGRNFEILEEVLVKAYIAGWRVMEIPFTYYPRDHGTSHARVFRFGLDLLRAFAHLRVLRYDPDAADADERAFYSVWPLRRYRERRRHQIVTAMARGAGRTLHVRCGSSVILQSLNNAIGLDARGNRLRYARQHEAPLVQAAIEALPLQAATFDCVVCADVITSLPPAAALLAEIKRVLRPGGLLIIGLPDASPTSWRQTQPGGASVRPSEGTGTRALLRELGEVGDEFDVVDVGVVRESEVILALRRNSGPGAEAVASVPAPAQLAPRPGLAETSLAAGTVRWRAS